MSHLKNFVSSMSNPELIGIAKNRYLDEEDQVAIAKHHYRRAHSYLIENSGLKPAAREILWDYKGYVNKCELVAYGHYEGINEKYHELYDGYADQLRKRSPWRITRVFLNQARWYSHGVSRHTKQTGTPSSIIEDIYLKDVQRKRSNNGEVSPNHVFNYYETPESTERYIIENPQTSMELIVKISASSPDPRNRTIAMRTMATRS